MKIFSQTGQKFTAYENYTPPPPPKNTRYAIIVTTGDHCIPAPSAQSIPREKQPPGQIVDAPEVSQPDPGQAEGEDTTQLRQKVKHLEKKFEDLLNAAGDDLKKRKVSIPKIRRSLFVRRASDMTDIDLVAGHRHEIREADMVDDLFDILSAGKCWDFLNPGLLKRIIDDHCSESQGIQHQKNAYMEELQQFRKATKAREFAKIFPVPTQSPKFSEVVFEMDEDWDGTLEDVEKLKQEVRGQEFLRDHMLNFKRSKSSSLSLVWAFPRSCPISTTILRIPPSFYLEHGIRRVLVKGVCVVDVKVTDGMGSCALRGVQHQIPFLTHSLRRSRMRWLPSNQILGCNCRSDFNRKKAKSLA